MCSCTRFKALTGLLDVWFININVQWSILNCYKKPSILVGKSWNAYTQGMYQLPVPSHISPSVSWWFGPLVTEWPSLCPHLELASLCHVLDAFERFIFLTVHVQPVHLQPCWTTRRHKVNLFYKTWTWSWFGENFMDLKEKPKNATTTIELSALCFLRSLYFLSPQILF